MKPLPDVHATVEDLDNYFQPYFEETQKAAVAAEDLIAYLQKKQISLAQRESYIKNIPGQARFLFKFRKGISDVLKDKCAPKNKHTGDVLNLLIKGVQVQRKAIQVALDKGHIYNMQNAEARKAFYLKPFAIEYLRYIEHWDMFEKNVRAQYKAAVEDEKKAVNLLAAYMKDKELITSKDVPPEEYKKFKKFYEDLAGRLD